MRKPLGDGFLDGFAGAGLFTRLHCPGRVEHDGDSYDEWDRRYASTARLCAVLSLAAIIVCAAILWYEHRYAAYTLLALGALRVVADIPVKNENAGN